MKEIIAIIRRDKLPATKKALDGIGCSGMTIYSVEGRGKQKGRLSEIDPEIPEHYEGVSRIMIRPTPSVYALGHQITKPVLYVPKRMLRIVVPDDRVSLVIDTLIRVNQTGVHGDGKIFVAPVEETWQIRTSQSGEEILQ
ncbi:MAG: P-II family nitrogen regulator [Nitrospirae bacterium]|nr:P-II family nitrogen regulator [Nitrospirota bacterium]